MTTDAVSPIGRLQADERGAVLVLGVFMCACMVGMLWYVAGIGDAIFFRQRVQEASDAAAFSAAVLHARGMNLIVMLNLMMACILGLRVAMRAIEAGLYVASALFLLIPPPVGPSMSGMALRGAAMMERAVKASQPTIDGTLRGLSIAQKGIGKVVPAAAIAGSYQVGNKYQPHVALSVGGNPTELRGLPIEEGTTDKLCNQAGRTVMSMIGWLIPVPLNDTFMRKAEKLVGSTVEKGQVYFCGFGKGQPPDLSQDVDQEVGAHCDQEGATLASEAAKSESAYRSACTKLGAACDPSSPEHGKLTQAQRDEVLRLQVARTSASSRANAFDGRQCRAQKKKQAEEGMQRANQSAAGDPKDSSAGNPSKEPGGKTPGAGKPPGTPKKVVGAFKNGARSAQMLAVTVGDQSILSVSPVGVQAGAWENGQEITIPPGAQFAVAQAEYFYDCKGAWADVKCNDARGGGEEAMWHLRWRARLRRYNAPFASTNHHLMSRLSALLVQLQYGAEVLEHSDSASAASISAVQALRAAIEDPIVH